MNLGGRPHYLHIKLYLNGDTEKNSNEDLVEAFRKRLEDKAGFKCVPKPLPMRNSKSATVYYLFFASQKPAGQNIVESIFQHFVLYAEYLLKMLSTIF